MGNRADKRHKCEAFIICSCFNNENKVNARMLNYSKDGMYFESDCLFPEGTNIYFKLKKCLFDDSGRGADEGMRTTSLAEVKWWKDMAEEKTSHFGIGVKYIKYY